MIQSITSRAVVVLASCLVNPFCALAGETDMGVGSEYTQAVGAGLLSFEYDPNNHQFSNVVLGHAIEFVDLNLDGVEDMVLDASYFAGSLIQYALGSIRPDGSIGYELYQMHSESSFTTATAGDLDGNGWPDLIRRDLHDLYYKVDWVVDGQVVETTVEEHEDLFHLEDVDLEVPGAGAWVRAGDLDGDQIADLVLNTTNEKLVVRWSSRDENTRFESYNTPAGTEQTKLYPVQDYDGDTVPDVLLLDLENEGFVFYAGQATDSIGAAQAIVFSITGFSTASNPAELGQFDLNPAMDVILRDSTSGENRVYLNFVQGTEDYFVLPMLEGEEVESVPGDIDQNGVDEVLLTSVDPLWNSGPEIEDKAILCNPSSMGAERLAIETGNTPDGLSGNDDRFIVCHAVEVSGDGLVDLIWPSDLSYHKLEQDSDPGFFKGYGLRVSPQAPLESGLPMFGASQFEGQKDPLHMLPVDVDGDGIDELYVVGDGTRARLVDIDAGTFANVPGANDGFMSAAADLDGDGAFDTVITTIEDELILKPIDNGGLFGPRIVVPIPNAAGARGVVVADVDLDGRDDVIAIEFSLHHAHVFKGVDVGVLSYHSFLEYDAGLSQIVKPAVLDHNRDGYPDLIYGLSGGFQVYENQGDGTFSEGSMLAVPAISSYWIVTEDMDQDGNVDIISANITYIESPAVSVHYLGSDGNIEDTVYVFDKSGVPFNEVVVGDLDQDGLLDLAWSAGRIGSGDQLAWNRHQIWMQQSDRKYVSSATLPAPASATVAMSDFNGDGALDVATTSDFDDSVRVHWGAPAACVADLTGEGDLNFLDISEFLSVQLDFNGDGSFNFLDISAYLQAFAAGCP
jgi:VCBS repeat protein